LLPIDVTSDEAVIDAPIDESVLVHEHPAAFRFAISTDAAKRVDATRSRIETQLALARGIVG